MKNIILGFVALASISAFADTCSTADYTCPERGLISEAQALGRVCIALENAGVPSYGMLKIGAKRHQKFLLNLKRAMNECRKYNQNGREVAYFDLRLDEYSYTGAWTPAQIAKDVRNEQRQVYR